MCFLRRCGIPWNGRPPFWVTTIHPPYGHTCPRVWGPHFRLGHGSDTICKWPRPNCVDIVHFRAHAPHDFILTQSTQQWGKRPLHIKGRSFPINTFSYASLDDVGFHGMQDPPFGSLQHMITLIYVSIHICDLHFIYCGLFAHTAAKHFLVFKESLCCNKDNLPSVVYSTGMEDLSSCSSPLFEWNLKFIKRNIYIYIYFFFQYYR